MGRNQDNDWSISGANSGTLRSSASAADQISFAGMSNLIGQNGKDDFILTATGSLTGTINGGTGIAKNSLKNEAAGATWALDKVATLSGKLNSQNFQNIHDLFGSGSDTLVGRNQNNDWQVISANAGTVQLETNSTDLTSFTGMINLTGNALNDSFLIASGTSVDGIIHGGVGGTNKLTNNTSNASWTLDSTTAYKGTVSGKTFINISEIVGNSGTLTGRGQANTWVISGAGSGTVQATDTTVVDKITFEGMNNLNGSAFADDFSIGATGSLAGTLSGGSGTGKNSLTSRSTQSIFAMNGANSGNLFDSSSATPARYAGFSNIQKITGGSTSDTLTGTNSPSTWTFDSINKLQIDGNLNHIEFASIENAQGGDGADIFNINTIVKNILGGDGDDTFNLASTGKATLINGERNTNKLIVPQNPSNLENLKNAWVLTAANQGTVTQIGDADYVTSFESIQSLVGSETDSLKGIDQANRWTISDKNKGVLSATNNSNTIDFSGMEKLIGGTESDYFDFSVDNAAVTAGVDGGDTKTLSNTIKSHVNIIDEWTLTGDNSGSLTIENNPNPYIPVFKNIQKREATDDVTVTGYIDLSKDYDGSGEIKGSLTGSPTVVGFNLDSVWNITGPNSGTIVIEGKTIKFSRFANLTGGNQDDEFSFFTGGAISGTIIGGTADENSNAINTIIGLDGTANTWQMTALNSGEVKAAGVNDRYAKFENIHKIQGRNQGDKLIGVADATEQNWRIGNSKNIFFLTDENVNIEFVGMNHIEGGAGNNTFINTISDSDWALSGVNSGAISKDDDKFEFSKINNIKGSGSDSLKGRDQDNDWQLTGDNEGSVSDITTPADKLNFSGINKLIGGAGKDVFNIGKDGEIDEIDGGNSTSNLDNTIESKARANSWVVESNGATKLYAIGGSIDFINFVNISNLTGGADQDDFRIANISKINGLLDGGTGTNNNVYLNTLGNDIDVKVGVGASASADVKILNITKINANRNSKNTLIAGNADNTFTITGENIGKLGEMDFDGFRNLTGGEYSDAFKFEGKDAKITGVIDGGTYSGSDSGLVIYVDELDLSLFKPDTPGTTVAMLNGTALNATAINITNIESVIGSASTSDTFIANDNSYTWTIDGKNSGTISNSGMPAAIDFSSFEILVGGAKDDLFSFAASGELTGFIDGGGQDVEDVVDLSKIPGTVEISLNTLTNGYRFIEKFIGNRTDSILYGSNNGDTWNLTGANSGNVNGTVFFSDFTDFVGGDGDDIFNLNQTDSTGSIFNSLVGGGGKDVFKLTEGQLLGSVYGGEEIDTFIVTNAVIGGSLHGEADDDLFSLNGGQISNSVFGGAGKDVFSISNSIVNGKIEGGAESDTLNATVSDTSAGTLEFVGGDGDDNIFVNGDFGGGTATHGSAVVNGGRLRYDRSGATHDIYYSEAENVNDRLAADALIIEGTELADAFSLFDNSYSLNNFTTIKYANKSNLTVAGHADDKVSIETSGQIEQAGVLTISKASVSTAENGVVYFKGLLLDSVASAGTLENRLKTNVESLSILTSAGDIFIQEKNGLNLSGFTSNYKVDLELDGDLTSSVEVGSIADFNVNAKSGNIILDKNNSLTGTVSLSTNKNITLNNSTGTTFGNVSADTLSVNSLGFIQGNGIIKVAGLTTLESGSDIIFINDQNNFGSVSIKNAINVDLVDSNSLTLSNVGALGNIKTKSQGFILNGAIDGGSLIVDAQTGDANLANTITTRSTIDLLAQNIIVAGNMSATAGIKVVSAGELSQRANISGGSVDLNVGKYTALPGVSTTATNGSVSIISGSDISTKNITATTDIILKAATDLTAGGALSSSNGIIDLLAGRNAVLSSDVNGHAGVNVAATNGSVQLQAALNSAAGDVNVTTAGDVTMAANATTSATEGNISYAGKNLTVTALSALNGEMTFNSAGSIIDANGDLINISAKKFTAYALSGIGVPDDLETNVAGLSLESQTNGIRIINTGEVTIDRMRSNGNIYFSNYKGDVLLDNSENPVFGRTEPDALLAGGTMNSNYNLSDLFIRIDSGDLLMAPGHNKSKEMPAIVASNAKIDIAGGNFGTLGAPIIVYVRGDFVYTASRYTKPVWAFGVAPSNPVKGPGVQTSLIDLLSAGAEQLVVVEEINQINPAIFTNVRNYVYDDIAIMLPADQRYDDDSLSSSN